MAKKRRATETRSPRKKTSGGRPKASAARRPPAVATATSQFPGNPPPTSPTPPARKPAYYEAIALYETGVRALQKHDFAAAADQFRAVIQRYPEERELLERARLYLRVCERETANRPSGPRTPDERVYAATVALNAGDTDAAVAHLRQALADAPNHDHAHYIMAVALCERRDLDSALGHLRKAIELNPDNRSNAIQDSDLSALHEFPGFREAIEDDGSASRRGSRSNRRR